MRTIQRLKENGFLGDEQFARDWVENRSTFRPRSKRMLAMELRQKGVAEEEIQQALAETGDEDNLAYQTRDQVCAPVGQCGLGDVSQAAGRLS